MSNKKSKKRTRKAGLPAECGTPRRTLSNRVQCGSAIVLPEARVAAVSVYDYRSPSRLRARLDEPCGHHHPAQGHPKRRAAREPITHGAAPVVHPRTRLGAFLGVALSVTGDSTAIQATLETLAERHVNTLEKLENSANSPTEMMVSQATEIPTKTLQLSGSCRQCCYARLPRRIFQKSRRRPVGDYSGACARLGVRYAREQVDDATRKGLLSCSEGETDSHCQVGCSERQRRIACHFGSSRGNEVDWHGRQ